VSGVAGPLAVTVSEEEQQWHAPVTLHQFGVDIDVLTSSTIDPLATQC
jgi:hypothetical protein